ncbi:M12 family metallo-peptidase [Chryseobacterium nakagawai]|nr:M12 family metallo-peptidase [Chryseobacterium nakagawai]
MMIRKIISLFLAFAFVVSCNRDNNEFNNGTSDYNHTRSVGASANDLLSNNKYNSLSIEIQYMPGYPPDSQAVEHLKSFLSSYLRKDNGITISLREIPGTPSSSLSADDIRKIENSNRTVFTGGSTMAVNILYTNGQYTGNANTLGIAYRNTSVALFGKTIHDNSGGAGQTSRTKLEATVLEHEIGHLLGLVDLGTPMQVNHKDSSNGNHCNNQNCLMYYASETTDILGFLTTGTIPQLDNNCKVDLKANGGK